MILNIVTFFVLRYIVTHEIVTPLQMTNVHGFQKSDKYGGILLS